MIFLDTFKTGSFCSCLKCAILLLCSTSCVAPVSDSVIESWYVKDTAVVDSLHPIAPFDNVSKIIAYQFDDELPDLPAIFPIHDSLMTVRDKKLNRKKIVKEADITLEKLKLEKVLHNRVLRRNQVSSGAQSETLKVDSMTSCLYRPHHCIVFYDEDGSATDFIEICFKCDERRVSKRNFGPFFRQTYCDLRKFFQNNGFDTTTLKMYRCD